MHDFTFYFIKNEVISKKYLGSCTTSTLQMDLHVYTPKASFLLSKAKPYICTLDLISYENLL